MVLRYIVCDTDLVEAVIPEPSEEVVQTVTETVGPEKSKPPARKQVRFWFLLLADVMVWASACYLSTGGRIPSVRSMLTLDKGVVTGILYNVDDPSALVCGKVLRQGDTVRGYKVIKIHKDRVELEKDGKRFTEWVQ